MNGLREVVLPEPEWRARRAAHAARADALTGAHLARRARAERHPVEDFLFTYYSLRPARLRHWHPGAGVRLEGNDEDSLDLAGYLQKHWGTVAFVRSLLAATAARPPVLSCFGLHEWAMVHRDTTRHPVPLRLGAAGTDGVVESHRIRCTHHDAFRFFSADARPLNTVQPRREDAVALEQPGCVHATMDLYKWSYKLGPAVPGELLLDCFELARDARAVDMRASPYDLSGFGYAPIRIELPAGKAEYVDAQRALAGRAAPLRRRLLDVCDLLGAATGAAPR